MSVILVTHDLGVVAGHTDEIIVMYAGQIVERAPTPVLFSEMRMPYTEALLESIPKLDDPSHTRLRAIAGRPPDLINPPTGCRFSPRCPYVQDRCLTEPPPLVEAETPGHTFACWYPVGSDVWKATKARLAEAGVGEIRSVRPRGPGGRRGHARRRPDRRPPTGAEPGGRRLMAGTGTAHLHPREDSLLRVEDLVVEFPVGRTGLKVNAVSGISLDVLPGETIGPGGRVGVRQVDHRSGHHAAAATDERVDQLRRPGAHVAPGRRHAHRAHQHPDDLPGPDLVAEPAAQGPGHRARAAEHLEDRHEGGAPGQGAPGPGGRRPGPRHRRRPPAPPVLRRPVPAHLHRPGARARAEADHLRRARVGARRQRPGPGAQPAGGPEAPLRADADVHRPRPGRRQERQRPRRRHVPRQAVRGRGRRHAVRAAGPPVHGHPAQVDPGPRPHGPAGPQQPDRGRDPVAGVPAVRLPLPDPLPAGPGPLRAGGAHRAGDRAGPLRRLPLPAHRRDRAPGGEQRGDERIPAVPLPAPRAIRDDREGRPRPPPDEAGPGGAAGPPGRRRHRGVRRARPGRRHLRGDRRRRGRLARARLQLLRRPPGADRGGRPEGQRTVVRAGDRGAGHHAAACGRRSPRRSGPAWSSRRRTRPATGTPSARPRRWCPPCTTSS